MDSREYDWEGIVMMKSTALRRSSVLLFVGALSISVCAASDSSPPPAATPQPPPWMNTAASAGERATVGTSTMPAIVRQASEVFNENHRKYLI